MMMNGRISDRSMKRYSLIRRFTSRMLLQIKKFCMQSGIDAEHIISMGALSDRVTITGNTKYDETYVEVSGRRETTASVMNFTLMEKGL